MPRGMYLRSGCDWHLHPVLLATMARFLTHQGLSSAAVEPLSLEVYPSYAKWLEEPQRIDAWPVSVERLDYQVDVLRIPFLSEGNIAAKLDAGNG
jgi:hypothetical protein